MGKKKKIMKKDFRCFVCAKPILERFRFEKLKAEGVADKKISKSVDDKVVYIGKGLYRHDKCDPNSRRWMNNPKLRKIHEDAMVRKTNA